MQQKAGKTGFKGTSVNGNTASFRSQQVVVLKLRFEGVCGDEHGTNPMRAQGGPRSLSPQTRMYGPGWIMRYALHDRDGSAFHAIRHDLDDELN